MDDSTTAEAADVTSPKLTSTPKAPPKVYERISPDVAALSPLSKSRYGRTRKPKITEDFYNIDVIFESVKEAKKSPRPAQHLKAAVSKVTKSKQPQSPSKPKDKPALKSPEINLKSAPLTYTAGDEVVTQSASPKAFNDANSKAIHNFFNKESGMSLLHTAIEPKTDPAKQTDVSLMAEDINALAPALSEESLSLQSVDVTKVLKIISTKSPDPLQNSDAKTSFKPVLKTYSNKRKNFNKVSVVESFGLPDKPIFPLESEATAGNEPKRIKNLDVAAPSSEKDINLVDKKLLDTPWKIASLSSDITENETLLDSCIDDFKEDEFLSPLKENVANKKPQIVLNEMLSLKTPTHLRKQKLEKPAIEMGVEKRASEKADSAQLLKTKSPRKQKLVVKELSVIQAPSCKDIKKREEVERSELHASKMRSPKTRTQVSQQVVSAEISDTKQKTDAQRNLIEDAQSPKKEKQTTRSTSAEARSPKKTKQMMSDESQSTKTQNCDILQPVTKQKDIDRKLQKNVQSPKKLPLKTNIISPRRRHPKVMLIKIEHANARSSQKAQKANLHKGSFGNATSPKRQIRTISIKVDSSKSPTKQKLSGIESAKSTELIQNDDAEARKNTDLKTLEGTAQIVKKTNEAISPNKVVKSLQSVANVSPEKSPVKTASQKRKRSESPKKPTAENVTQHEDKSDEVPIIVKKPRGRPRKHAVEASAVVKDKLDPGSLVHNTRDIVIESSSPTKRSSRLAKSSMGTGTVHDISTETPNADVHVNVELDEMSLLDRSLLQSSTLNPLEASETLNDTADVSVGDGNDRKHVAKGASSPIKRSSRLTKSSVRTGTVRDISTEIPNADVDVELDEMSLLDRSTLQSSTLNPSEASETLNNTADFSVGNANDRKHVAKGSSSPIKRSSRLAKSSMGTGTVHDISTEVPNADVDVELDEMSLLDRSLLQSSTLNPSEASETLNSTADFSVGDANDRKHIVKGASSTKRSSRPTKSSAEGIDDVSKEVSADESSMDVDEISLLDRKSLNPDLSAANKSVRRSIRSLGATGIEQNLLPDVATLQESENCTVTPSKRKYVKKQQLVPVDTNESGFKVSEELKVENSSNVADIRTESNDIALGDLMWARIRGFPYWPCLITEDPMTHEYKVHTIKRSVVLRKYHVRFFGDRGRRSWIYQTSLMRFTGKNDLKHLYMEIKDKPVPSMLLQSYIVKANIRAKWETATSEAESLKSSTVQERFDFFFNMFASEKEKQKKLNELTLEIKSEDLESDAEVTKPKTEHHSRSKVKLGRPLKKRSKSLQAADDLKAKQGVKSQTNDDCEKLTVNEQEEILKLPKTEKQQLTELNLKHNSAASKIKERQASHDSSVDESMFLKNPWQGFHMPKKSFGPLLNEATSECSLSDTDSLSKSSSNTPIPNTFKAQVTRQKRNNLFRGVPKDRVCQICKKPGEILKCKGPCSGIFHNKCASGRYANEPTIIKEEPIEPSFESEQLCDESAKSDLDVNIANGLPDTTQADELDLKSETENNVKENGVCLVDEVENEMTVIKDVKAKGKKLADTTDSVVDASSSNNKVEIVYIDCDDSDLEHTLTPKVRLTPNIDFSKMSLAEQIDYKMKEVMQRLEKNPRYADSTTDYTSSEESSSNLPPPAQKPVQKKKSLKIKHVTADHISFASSASSEDLICETTNLEVNGSVSSTKNSVSFGKEKGKSANMKNEEIFSNEEKHVTGDVTPHSEGSSESNFNKDDFKDFKCGYCIAELEPPCFVCNKEISSKGETFRQKCSIYMCGKFYHPECLKMWPQTQWSLISTAKHKNSDKLLDTFVCPAHVCHTCASDDPHAAISRCTSDKVVKCLHCPATYHTTNYCVPAGTIILSTSQIVCPRHLGREVVRKGRVSKLARTINTPWCFICSKGGALICCETCPTSVHTDCLAINLLEDGTFICEDCETGRFPLYDEIVWVKLGTYRWWPAVILFPNEIPDNIKNIPHGRGEFVVKFFGTHDHYWVGRGRVFLFQEGDRGHCSPTKKRVDALFKKSIEEAAIAHQTKKIFKKSKEAEIRTGMKPPPYIRVKVNKPVGNVRLFDGNISNTTSCECDPNQNFPCGPDSDCLNRLLLTECDPNICPAKNKCNNQRFEKRQYPPLVPYKTPSRGWGLKSLAPIRKGDFVIEYVGEIIDEQEYQRRIGKMHEQKDENYYFLTIDKDRIIDAGPKGNLARFMNHCCQPNCETQKWTVNGDTRVGLFAMEDIAADSELTFNYNLECIGTEKKICKCGAPRCSGFIGVKAKQDESQKKPKKGNNIKKKKRSVTPQVFKSDGPCCICGQSGDVGACHNKICTKFYHLQCVNLEFWPEGKWVCPWHNCSICTKRTIRCCVKCVNSYCPVHSEGNVRYDKLLGFVCSEHDPTKESHELSNQNVSVKNSKNPATFLSTEETDVTSTTSDEVDHPIVQVVSNDLQDLITTESVTSTPIKKNNIANFVHALQAFESDLILDSCEIPKLSIPKEQEQEKPNILVTGKRKRGRQKQGNESTPKRLKISDHVDESAVKPKPSFAASTVLDLPTQHEIKLSSSVPARHLRTTRNNTPTNVENKRFLKQQNELEKDLPIRKRSRPRCEATL